MGDHDQRSPGGTDASRGDPGHRKDDTRTPGPDSAADSKAGMEREVGDLDDPDAVEDEGALPGRMGGGLAGG